MSIVLTSQTIKKKNGLYESHLLLPEQSFQLSSYLAGKHVSAMVLLEAAQQMNTAVIDKFLLRPADRSRLRLVLNNAKTIFHQFVYPFPVVMQYKTLKMKKSIAQGFAGEARVIFFQNQEKCLEIFFCYALLDKQSIDRFEDQSIQRIARAYSV